MNYSDSDMFVIDEREALCIKNSRRKRDYELFR